MKKFLEKYFGIIFCIVLMILASIMAYIARSRTGFWFDEMYSVWMADKSFPVEFFKGIWQDDVHAPFYHIILHFYIKLFGVGFTKIQLMNIFLTIWLIPITYTFGKEIFNKKVGVFASIFLTFNFLFVYNLCFTRFYPLSGLFFTLSTFFIFKLRKEPTKKNIVLVSIFNILLIYTLTLGSVYVFIQGLVFGIYFLIKRKDIVKPFLKSSGLTLICAIPYIPLAFHQYMNVRMSIMETHNALFSINSYECLTAMRSFIYQYSLYDITDVYFEYLLFGVITFFIIKSFFLKKSEERLIFSLFIAIYAFHSILCLTKKAPFNTTYCGAFLPLFILCFANFIASIKDKTIKILLFSLMVIPQFVLLTPKGVGRADNIISTYRFKALVNTLKKYNLKETDLIYSASSSKLLKPFGIMATPMDSCHNATYLIYNKDRMIATFGEDSLKLKTTEEKNNFLNNYFKDKNIRKSNKNHYEKMIAKTKVGSKMILNLAAHKFDNVYNKTTLKTSMDYVNLINSDKTRWKLIKTEIVPITHDPLFIYERIK